MSAARGSSLAPVDLGINGRSEDKRSADGGREKTVMPMLQRMGYVSISWFRKPVAWILGLTDDAGFRANA